MVGKSSRYKGVTLFRPTNKFRAQISAGGKTTSLGDHDTEEAAAVAFDRACINKAGRDAKTNFPLSNYEHEMDALQAMSAVELVAMLRSRARRSGAQTSRFRGVSLLKQTNKWHAQINFSRRQVHLGFFPSEEAAARAYDRAAINKGSQDGSKVFTNFDISDYAGELVLLRRLPLEELIKTMHGDGKRQEAYEMLSTGLEGKVEGVLGKKFASGKAGSSKDLDAIARLQATTERAQPKMTERDELYHQFAGPQHPGASGAQQSSGSGRSQPAGPAGQGGPLVGLSANPKAPLPKATAASAALQKGRKGKKAGQAKAGQAEAAPAAAAAKPPGKSGRGGLRSSRRSLFEGQPDARTSAERQASGAAAPPTPPKAAARERFNEAGKQGAGRLGPQQGQAQGRRQAQAQPRREAAGGDALSSGGPPTPTPKRVRTPLYRVPPAAQPQQQQPQAAAPGPLEALAQAAAHTRAAVPAPLQPEQRPPSRKELQAEHRRQQAEQRALMADVYSHVTARPLTKRQEALAARKQEEAAATLAGHRGGSPLPEEVGEALLDFATLAEQLEREEQAAASGSEGAAAAAGRPARGGIPCAASARGIGGRRARADSEETESMTTFPGFQGKRPAEAAAGGEGEGGEPTSKRRRGILGILGF